MMRDGWQLWSAPLDEDPAADFAWVASRVRPPNIGILRRYPLVVLTWLIADTDPATAELPPDWSAEELAGAARRWFRRLRHTDDLDRLLRAATGTSVGLARTELVAIRVLLEDPQTWRQAGHGAVAEVIRRIASCLPPRDGRTAGESNAAAVTIARGLLEFAVADLDPQGFQQVVLARLRRLEVGQAPPLDEALLGLQAGSVAQNDLDVQRLLARNLGRVLDRLPPRRADRAELAAYLRTLIDSLDTDPWPRHQRFAGPALTPSTIERKLRVTTAGYSGQRDLDADALAGSCRRLVLLGGPGSGKTWLAKRTARRCAEDALNALAAGQSLDEIELPLYITCPGLSAALGGIREAVITTALNQLFDLGGSRLTAAIKVLFTERDMSTLLVIDSLDEARGSDQRLRQADTLPWRIILTSRPRSWAQQLDINDRDSSHVLGQIQPLRYPDDVEHFIERWFVDRPERGKALVAEIARRPSLQQAATVPLLLAFYCIVGSDRPLPEFRHQLYAMVLRRMLTGLWRGGGHRQPDAATCLQMLGAWAWSGAMSDPISSIGTWTDEIFAQPGRLSLDDEEAIDHIATTLSPPDIDTGMTLRRFIDRSIGEHLVAEHVAGLPVDQAVGALLPHIWYDPDWKYPAAAALAMHPQRDHLLQELTCHALRSDQVPGDLSVIDGGWEWRGFLARVASESSEDDWSPEAAEMIWQARLALAQARRLEDLGGTASWGTSSRQACKVLLGLLAGEADGRVAAELARGVVQLAPTTQDKAQARGVLLGLLAGEANGRVAAELARGVVQLAPTTQDRAQAREVLLGLLAAEADGRVAAELARGVVQLAPTTQDKAQAREVLLGLIGEQTYIWVAARLMGGVIQLVETAEEKSQTRQILLELLAGQTSAFMAAELARGVVRLQPTAQDETEAREVLMGLLAGESGGKAAAELARGVVRLQPTAEDEDQTRAVLLRLLTDQTDGRVAASRRAGWFSSTSHRRTRTRSAKCCSGC